jgi:hypothetical protein
MDRTSFYEWKMRFQTHGLDGLKDLPPIPKSQTNNNSPSFRKVSRPARNLTEGLH